MIEGTPARFWMFSSISAVAPAARLSGTPRGRSAAPTPIGMMRGSRRHHDPERADDRRLEAGVLRQRRGGVREQIEVEAAASP